MNTLYDTGQFASLTYRDMPFVISPNLWGKISNRNDISMPAKERLHGDNIKVNIDLIPKNTYKKIFEGS